MSKNPWRAFPPNFHSLLRALLVCLWPTTRTLAA
nr:MAG TPA_asm: hypothetical protein [Caudoviricetes sp.]